MTPAWPTISIVTPSYNQGRFLEATLRSVLDQGYPALQYLVVDGGSTDGSVDIIRRYADRLAWWVSAPDRGQSEAINKGLRRATGDLVAWLNSDDTYEPGTFESVAAFFRTHPDVGMVYGDVNIIDADGRVLKRKRELPFDPIMGCLIGFGMLIPQPTAFWRRSLLERVGSLREDLQYNMDGEYWSRMARETTVVHLPMFLANTRWHAAAKTVMDRARVEPENARAMRMEIEVSYARLPLARFLPFRHSGPLRRAYRMKRFLSRLVRGHYVAQKGWW